MRTGPKLEPARLAAIAAGEVTYLSAKPCVHGHTCPRTTATSRCIECRLATQAKAKAKLGRPTIYHAEQDPAWQAAHAAGEGTYVCATPCRHGHIGRRQVGKPGYRGCGRCCTCTAATLRKTRARPEARERALIRTRQRRGTPIDQPKRNYQRAEVVLDGETLSLAAACARTGVSRHRVGARVSAQGISYQEAFEQQRAQPDERAVRKAMREQARAEKRAQLAALKQQAKIERLAQPPRAPRKRGLRDPATGHYISKPEMLAEVLASQAKQRVTDRLGRMLLLLAHRYFLRRNWRTYTCRGDFEDAATMAMLGAVWKFDRTKSENPFGYFTTVARHAALAVLRKEQTQWAVMGEQRVLSEIDLESEAAGAITRRRTGTAQLSSGGRP